MFRKSLNLKVNLAIAAVLVVVLGGAALVTISAQSRQAIANTESQAKLLSQTLTNIIRIDMEARSQTDVLKVIRMMGRFQDIETIRIFDSDGIIVHSADEEEIGKKIAGLVYDVSRRPDGSQPFFSEERGHGSFCTVEAMHNEASCNTCHDPRKNVVGILEVCLSMANTETQIEHNARFMLGATLATVVLVTAAISLLLTAMVNRPVKTLVRTMKRAEEGDLEAQVPVRQDDELGRLGRSFNSMISRLGEASREVDRLHREQMTRAERLASIGEMAASVAHEIKNPLAGLAGATQILRDTFEPDDSRRPVVEEMLKLTDRLDKTIRDLLRFARESEPTWKVANLNEVVEETLFFVTRDDGQPAGTIARDLDPDLPATAMDPRQIQQVLFNLVINARQAVGEEGQITVRTAARPTRPVDAWPGAEDCVEVCVQDDGPGIPPDRLGEIFQPFYTTKTQGTGLGLPISRKIVEAHGGILHVESRPGEGTAFYVWLPRRRVTT